MSKKEEKGFEKSECATDGNGARGDNGWPWGWLSVPMFSDKDPGDPITRLQTLYDSVSTTMTKSKSYHDETCDEKSAAFRPSMRKIGKRAATTMPQPSVPL